MAGTFEGQDDVAPGIVAFVNGLIIAYSERQVYTRDDRFWYVQDPVAEPPVVRRGADLLQHPLGGERRSNADVSDGDIQYVFNGLDMFFEESRNPGRPSKRTSPYLDARE
jgi:hypothetical protein